MIRLFVALKIPPATIDEILKICSNRINKPNLISWESRDKIHLTLKFIGEVEDSVVQPIAEELKFIESYKSFNSTISKFGFFYKFKEPKILRTDLNTDSSLFKLVDELNQRLLKFDIKIEKREFKPHLTILRIKKDPGIDFINKFKDYSIDEIKFTASQVALMESKLLHSGAAYKEINIYELR